MTDLYGLVLAGGRSTRMGRDKAALVINGQTTLARASGLLATLCERNYISVRSGEDDSLRGQFEQIADRFGSTGPADGIASAHQQFPHAAWLVVACDLPLLDGATLDHLHQQRDPRAEATAFRSAHDGLPEPLCAIYEPVGASKILGSVEQGLRCPRKMLLQMKTHLLDQPNVKALENTNTPEDWRQVMTEK